MTVEPSLGEILRRLEETTRAIESLGAKLEAGYVRKDVYTADYRAVVAMYEQKINEVKGDVDEMKSARKSDSDRIKQLGVSVASSIILLLIVAAFAVSNFMARGGA